jgi:hypothetical protein
MLTLDAFHALGDEAATFGYPCERSFLNSGPQVTFGYPQQAPFGERRVTASMKKCRPVIFVPFDCLDSLPKGLRESRL